MMHGMRLFVCTISMLKVCIRRHSFFVSFISPLLGFLLCESWTFFLCKLEEVRVDWSFRTMLALYFFSIFYCCGVVND